MQRAMWLEFDRGTLLPYDAPDGFAAHAPTGFVWDDRVERLRAKACDYAELRAALQARGIECPDTLRPLRPVDATHGAWSDVALRPYQEAALAAWTRAGRRGTIVLPTGAGKTRTALAAVARTGCRALCLVPTRVLLHQWADEAARHFEGRIALLGDGERDVGPLTIATYASALLHMPAAGASFGLVVVDEAHHVGDALRPEALEMCVAPLRLGLTATAPADGAPARALEALVGEVVYRLTIADLAGGALAPFRVQTMTLRFSPEEQWSYNLDRAAFWAFARPYFDSNPRAEWADLCRAARASAGGRAALAAWRRARDLTEYHAAKCEVVFELLRLHHADRVLVFTGSNATAYAIAQRNLVAPLTCAIGRRERAELLAAFAEGAIRTLVSTQVLNEGLDVPAAGVAILCGGTGREREFVQRIGRLLRPAPGKCALVYHLVTRRTGEERHAAVRRAALGPRAGGENPAVRAKREVP